MAESETTTRATQQGICVTCERLLPKSNFRRDAAGRHTAWCETCREAASKRWSIEPDLVEAVYALYVQERTWRAEAEAVMQIRVQMGQVPASELQALQCRIVGHEGRRFSRIPERLHRFRLEGRAAWYQGINMAAPEILAAAEKETAPAKPGRTGDGKDESASVPVPNSGVPGETDRPRVALPLGLGDGARESSVEGPAGRPAGIRLDGARQGKSAGRRCREAAPGPYCPPEVSDQSLGENDGVEGAARARDWKMAAAGRDR